MDIDEALNQLENLPFEDLGFAHIDHHRTLRRGFPEVIFCQNKTTEQAVTIMQRMAEHSDVLATRANKEMYQEIKKSHPQRNTTPMRGPSSFATRRSRKRWTPTS